ncbi:hypothetical protein [Candidatus Mycoplasma haematohominis]|uniref:hypothetical protein n=1 Tax=Candidatus Mycoplasma haematohominis TaxID=1494318 RepID=UPI001C0A7744|nr:hypothetical protein [Candidatus Mycoplasma haemohominis]
MTPQAAAGIGAGAVLAGGTGIGAYMIATSSSNPITLEEAIKNEGVDKSTYENTSNLSGFGDNKKELVADLEKNRSWWDSRYKENKNGEESKLKDAKSGAFQAVTSGYGSEAATALNKVCDTHYKKPKTEFEGDSEGTKTKADLKLDVEKFCTVSGTKVLSLS